MKGKKKETKPVEIVALGAQQESGQEEGYGPSMGVKVPTAADIDAVAKFDADTHEVGCPVDCKVLGDALAEADGPARFLQVAMRHALMDVMSGDVIGGIQKSLALSYKAGFMHGLMVSQGIGLKKPGEQAA